MIFCSRLGKPDGTMTASIETGQPIARYAVTFNKGEPRVIARMNPQTGQWRDVWKQFQREPGGKMRAIIDMAWRGALAVDSTEGKQP